MKRLVAVIAVIALSSCGFGAKQALVERVEAAADRTLAQPSITGVLGANLAVLKTGSLSPLVRQPPIPVTASFEVRPGEGATLAGRFPNVVFTDERIYLKRPDAGPREARPWLELALADVNDEETPFDPRDHTFNATRALIATIDPRLLLDLAAAPLTGSIEDRGADKGLQHFEANFDLSKAMDERRADAYDDDRIETVNTILERLSVDEGVVPGHVWFDGSGLRRVRLGLKITPTRFEESRLDLEIRIDPSPKKPTIAEPEDIEVIVVDSLAALQSAAGRGGAPSA